MKKQWPSLIIIVIATFSLIASALAMGTRPGVLKIGAILTLSGNAAPYGESAKNALDMGLKEINSKNLLSGKKISLVYEDDQLDPKTGVTAFKKLTEIDQVPCVIGPLTSSVALAIAPLANEKRVVMLSPSASSPALTTAGDYIFRNVASDEFETKVMARYAYESLNLQRVGLIYVNNDFGVGFKQFFSKFFINHGGEVLVSEGYEQGATDFRTQLLKIKIPRIDALYLIGYKEMGNVLRQAKELGIVTQFLSYSAVEDPDIINQAGDATEGLVYTRQSFDPDDPQDVVKKFSSSYRELYKRDPDPYAALAYDSIMILAKVINEGGDSPEEIKRTLYGIEGFPGVTGETTFDNNGDVTKSISIKKIQGGEFHYIIKSYFKP